MFTTKLGDTDFSKTIIYNMYLALDMIDEIQTYTFM